MTLPDADEKQRKGVLGEDTCDLFATIEDSFGIRFPDYEAVLGKSVRELAECISAESTYPKADRCLSAVAFYRLRRAFHELFGTPRGKIRAATSLATLLPWCGRRVRWRLLQHELDLTLPELTFPLWLFGSSLGIAVASSIALSTAMKAIFGAGLGLMGVVFGSFALWIFVLKCSIPLARTIPGGCETFGGLVKLVLARNYATFASQYGLTSQDEITSLLCRLIALEVGLNQTDITPTTHIPGDLNIE
jgi:hypothetical protein